MSRSSAPRPRAIFARLDATELSLHEGRKPFGNLLECSQTLHKLGLLLAGLHLGQGMSMMDFGAGLCWLSRHLNQLGCETAAVDVSETALQLGRQVFDRYYIGQRRAPAHFLRFDGHRLDWPDASIDRVLCFDAFHHVPNVQEVLSPSTTTSASPPESKAGPVRVGCGRGGGKPGPTPCAVRCGV